MLKDILRLIRVKQWVKNAFVLAPLLFSLKFTQADVLLKSALAFGAFCFIASVIYVLNDIVDRRKDAMHPKKKNRPIASGKISVHQGIWIALICFVAGSLCLWELHNLKTFYTLALYVIINILYSYKLKHVVLLDVLIIAIGFILRVYAGAYAIGVPVSSFIFMATLFLSLFLAFTKRKAELLSSGDRARAVLKMYSLEIINQYIVIAAALTILCYALYTLEPSTLARFDTNRLIYSVILVIYGMFRYIYVLDRPESSEDPTENLFKDKGLIGVCVLYVAYVLAIFMNII